MTGEKRRLNIYQKFTYSVVTNTESFFYKLGVKVGSKPVQTIAICFALVVASAFGFLRFYQEKNPMKLWVPPNSNFAKDTEWLVKTLEIGFRPESIILQSDNVLEPESIQLLMEVHEKLERVQSPTNITWNDVCFKLPKVTDSLARLLRKESENEDTDIEMLCSFIESIPMGCYHKSILELWNYDKKKIQRLTKQDVINRINNHDEMLFLGHLKDYIGLLGGVVKNQTGHIVSAMAVRNFWMTRVNFSSVDMNKAGNLAGTADWANEDALEWELSFESVLDKVSSVLPNGTHIYYMSARSFGDITSKTLFQDMDRLFLGGVIMGIYVLFVISKYNLFEMRIALAGLGLLSVGMSFVVGCGICFIIGIPYGPVHTSLPFLLMGLGVDDMFVIMACWDDLTPEQKKLPIPEMLGLILKHAGVSITITSVTDILAFLIGSSTILPSLQSYCIYAAISVFMTFAFAVTFFIACFALDQRRIQQKRNGIVPCIVQEKYEVNACSQRQISNKAFHWIFNNIFFTKPVKIFILLLTIGLAGLSIKNCLQLEKKFNLHWFVPKTNQLSTYFEKRLEYFPTHGYDGGIYMGEINYVYEIPRIKNMVDMLQKSDIVANVVDWLNPLRDYVNKKHDIDIYNETLNETDFSGYLSNFLMSPSNAKYQSNFQFEGHIECGQPAPKIKMAYIGFNFPLFSGPSEYLPAMHEVRKIAEQANFTTGDKFCTTWAVTFSTWVTDEVIDIEVLRNLQLALLCVMICTILLVADLQTCFWIFICVLLTMINVCGFMQMWGLTIDLVSCIGLELAIGLCVDYATHIGHTFLTLHGTQRDRALKTVTTIGSAVLYGGISMLIGVLMLNFSEAYIFQSFFKIFFLVIVFGLYHGVVVMPIILSILGPNPYNFQKREIKTRELAEMLEVKNGK